MSKFLALPEELQVEILQRAAFRADEPMRSPDSKASLMKVCRSWNALVLSVPGFWSTIVIHTEMDTQAISLAVAQALTWEQTLQLVVDLEWSTSPLESRWTPEKDWDEIYAWCASMLPPLRTSIVLEFIGLELAAGVACCHLHADCQSMFSWPASMPVCNENIALKELTCSRVNPTWKTPFVYASLTRLSLVELRGSLSYDDFKAMVACAKILEHLELSRTQLSQEDPGMPVVQIVSRKVRTFTLGVDWGPASYVLPGLQLPSLETFTLRAPNGQLGGDVVALCMDYFQSASAFVVECHEPDEDWLQRCALALQQAQCVDVRTVSCTLLERWVEHCATMPLLRAIVVPVETTVVLEAILRETCPAVAIYVPVLTTDYFKEKTVSGARQSCYLPIHLQTSSQHSSRRVHLHFRDAPASPQTTVADVDFRSVWHNTAGSFNLAKMTATVREFPADDPRPLDSAFTILFVDQKASSGIPVNEHIALFLPEEEEVWFGNILVFKHRRGAETPLASVRSADASLARMVALQ
ncbi:hypothetical protein R3P38DRAFT_3191233 [Favolaschia claudopus]|uniref:F-box domain-containing protein n=1 Tax=Favolaschia claudopus TaxID=2862362 RepID=A0AAW0BL99_9AGAR